MGFDDSLPIERYQNPKSKNTVLAMSNVFSATDCIVIEMVQFIVDFNETHVFEYETLDMLVIEDIKKQLSRLENISYELISIQYNYDNDTHNDDDDRCDRLKCDETTIVILKVSLIGGIKGGKGGMLVYSYE